MLNDISWFMKIIPFLPLQVLFFPPPPSDKSLCCFAFGTFNFLQYIHYFPVYLALSEQSTSNYKDRKH